MKQVLVIGYGNTLRSDDGVGVYAVREMQKNSKRTNVEFMELAQLQPELAETLSHKDLAIFVDAAMHGISGEIHFETIAPTAKVARMSHSCDPETLLYAAKELYGHTPKAILATVSGECFGLGTKLSPEVEVSMKGLAVRIGQIIDEFLDEAIAV